MRPPFISTTHPRDRAPPPAPGYVLWRETLVAVNAGVKSMHVERRVLLCDTETRGRGVVMDKKEEAFERGDRTSRSRVRARLCVIC